MSEKESYNPYCPVCEGCGEEYCCTPLSCKQDPDGTFCQAYLNDLKFSYLMYSDVAEKIYNEEEKYAELVEHIKNRIDINFDKIYGQSRKIKIK